MLGICSERLWCEISSTRCFRTNTLAASPALIHLFPPSSPGKGLFPGRDLAFACQRGHLSLGRTPAIILCFKKLKKKKAHKTEAGTFPEAVQSHKLGWQKNGVTFLERKRDTSAPLAKPPRFALEESSPPPPTDIGDVQIRTAEYSEIKSQENNFCLFSNCSKKSYPVGRRCTHRSDLSECALF